MAAVVTTPAIVASLMRETDLGAALLDQDLGRSSNTADQQRGWQGQVARSQPVCGRHMVAWGRRPQVSRFTRSKPAAGDIACPRLGARSLPTLGHGKLPALRTGPETERFNPNSGASSHCGRADVARGGLGSLLAVYLGSPTPGYHMPPADGLRSRYRQGPRLRSIVMAKAALGKKHRRIGLARSYLLEKRPPRYV